MNSQIQNVKCCALWMDVWMNSSTFKPWSFCGDRTHWHFLGHTAASRCEGLPVFWELTPNIQAALVLQCKQSWRQSVLVLPGNEDGVSSRDGGKPLRLDAAFCPRTFHWLAHLCVSYRPPTFMDRLAVITSSINHDNVDVGMYGLRHLSSLLRTEKDSFQACIGDKDHVDPIIREVKYSEP